MYYPFCCVNIYFNYTAVIMTYFVKSILLCCFIIPLLFSCSVPQPAYYFKSIKNDTTITNAFKSEELMIKKGDVLSVHISSLNPAEDDIFNKNIVSASVGTSQGFTVDEQGAIHLHRLGKQQAEGLTRAELKKQLEQKLQPYLKDPVVTVGFSNHFITVIGEVGKPQLLNMPAERISLIDVLAQSGNVTPVAQLNSLMVIREKEPTVKEFKHINLEDHSLFTSAWYYLQPNDVVVVNPDEKKAAMEYKKVRYQQVTAIVFQSITTALIIYQTFFRN
jgi:polysaccharide biosynthesis/export protein